jgi:hypothetical protein
MTICKVICLNLNLQYMRNYFINAAGHTGFYSVNIYDDNHITHN